MITGHGWPSGARDRCPLALDLSRIGTGSRWQTLQILFGPAAFVAEHYAQQKATGTGVFSKDKTSITRVERNIERVYMGPGGGVPGFNGRLVAALVDLRCDELLR